MYIVFNKPDNVQTICFLIRKTRDMSLPLSRERACARVCVAINRCCRSDCVWQIKNLLAAFATVLQTAFVTAFATLSLQTKNVLTVAKAFPGNHKICSLLLPRFISGNFPFFLQLIFVTEVMHAC